ncbi:MAG: nucleotide exchange factor GrpE [Gammaproteobacteria bacterium TMED78]|nr:MAG: nucleotide exchange factor GrpE [Gammaproteobacteria bacterium TMED78]|tara:strand:+ start:2643 stop:3227 length:585 start_codon:yes stop_codon:yes gene_type:complete
MSNEDADEVNEAVDLSNSNKPTNNPIIENEEKDKVIEDLNNELSISNDKYLRLAADMDNLRKRTSRDIDNARKYGLESFLISLLPLIDSLSLATDHSENKNSLLDGLKATVKLLDSIIEDAGVRKINPHNEIFDPLTQEAIQTRVSDTTEPNRVLEVVQVGYTLNDKVLRAARVVVSTDVVNSEQTEDTEKKLN